MTIIAQKPAAAVFGDELPEQVTSLKSMLSQMAQALRANGVTVAEADPMNGPQPAGPQTPLDILKQELLNIQAAMVRTYAAKTLVSTVTQTPLLTLTALAIGDAGNAATVAVADGTASGKKITVVKAPTTETYDNLASIDAAVTAIHGVSVIVDTTKLASGTLADLAAANLTGGKGATFTAPTYAVGDDDASLVTMQKWASAMFAGLQAAGYLS